MQLHVHDFTEIVLLGDHIQSRRAAHNFSIEVHGPIKRNMFRYNVIVIRLRGSIDQDVGHSSGSSSKHLTLFAEVSSVKLILSYLFTLDRIMRAIALPDLSDNMAKTAIVT